MWHSCHAELVFHQISKTCGRGITSGLPQVCELWLGVNKGKHPVRHLTLKIMAFNSCGRQLARWLGWAAPAYYKKEGETLHPGACKLSLQYDGISDRKEA